ncbi:MAG: HU family DNA-binding protein [Bacteroidia bacterium]|nr:HU family DNA-binding protein [Bacteroidia bacterium]
MDREQLVTALSERLEVPAHSIRVFLHAYFDTAKTLIRAGEVVDLGGLGSFEYIRDNSSGQIRYYSPLPRQTGTTVRMRREDFVVPLHAVTQVHTTNTTPVDVAEIVTEVLTPQPTVSLRRYGDRIDAFDDSAAEEADETELPLPSPSEEVAYAERDEAGEDEDSAFFSDASYEQYDDESEDAVHYATPSDWPDGSASEQPRSFAYEAASVHDTVPVSDGGKQHQAVEAAADVAAVSEVPNIVLAEETEHQDFSDGDSFYKNRDQLFHPPEKKTSRGLLIIAVLVTLCVLAIILYLVYSDAPVHELPGIDPSTGHYRQAPTLFHT